MKWRRIYTWTNRILGMLVILMVIGSVLAYFWIHSERGMDWMAERIKTATQDGVTVQGLSGELPFFMSARSVEWRDTDGTLLASASNLHARISVRALTRRALIIRTISADQVRLEQLPAKKERESTNGESRERSDTAIPLREGALESLRIESFHIGTNIIGYALEGMVSGSFEWRIDGIMSATLGSELLIDREIPVAITLTAEYNSRQDILTLSQATVSNQWDTMTGTLVYQFAHGSLNSEVRFTSKETSRYQLLHGLAFSGPASAQASASRVNHDHPVHILLTLESPALRYGNIVTEQTALNGTAMIDTNGISYQANASAQFVSTGNWRFDQPSIKAQGTRQQHQAALTTSGSLSGEHTFELETRAHVEIGDEPRHVRVSVHPMQGRWNETPISLTDPAVFDMRDVHSSISISHAEIDHADVSLAIELTDWKIAAVKAVIHSVDLAKFTDFAGTNAPSVSGTATLSADFKDLLTSPFGTARLSAESISIYYGFLYHFEKADLELGAKLTADELVMNGKVIHPLLDRFETLVTVPVATVDQFIPLVFQWKNGIGLRVRLDGSLKEIGDTMLTRPMALSGYVSMDLAAEGFPHRPEFDGFLLLTNGQFRSLETGTFLDHIDVRLHGSENRLKLEHASARDGGRGRISAEGEISFEEDWQTDWTLHASITNATLFRLIRTDLPLSGNIQGVGNRDTQKIEGSLWLEPFKFNIPRRLPPSIRELDVVEINHPDPSRNTVINGAPAMERESRERSHPVELDIRLTTRRGFEVAGRGLQSEWRGEMRLTGNTDQPQLIGSVRVARGYAMLLGRRFNIDEGRIDMTGPVPPNPMLYISASTRISDVTARIVAVGTVNNPEISLVSDPMLPEDEIMAVILFGKSLETMTPWQAIALANGLRILSGGGGDVVSVMENSQKLIQVDQIDIKQDEEGEGFSSVVVGKYIGRNLYVEGEKGFGDAEDSITVTLELTPRLVLETETSPRIREGVSLFWRREF